MFMVKNMQRKKMILPISENEFKIINLEKICTIGTFLDKGIMKYNTIEA